MKQLTAWKDRLVPLRAVPCLPSNWPSRMVGTLHGGSGTRARPRQPRSAASAFAPPPGLEPVAYDEDGRRIGAQLAVLPAVEDA